MLDLDPSVEDLDAVRRATRLAGELLDEIGLESLLKTTGSRGYHVVVPLQARRDFDDVRELAKQLADVLVARDPALLTTEARKDRRGDRVLVDVQRNGYGQTMVPPYAVRALPGAPVSTPIRWDELAGTGPRDHDLASVPRRLAQIADPWRDARPQGLGRARERLRRLLP